MQPARDRDRTSYRADQLRHDIVHTFPDGGVPEMAVLRGDLALEPGAEATYRFSYPIAKGRPPPRLGVRFLPRRRFGEVAACGPDAPPVPLGPADLADLPIRTETSCEPVTLVDDDLPGANREAWRRWAGGDVPDTVEVERLDVGFRVPDEEGAIVFRVDADGVVVYVKPATAFPTPGVDDLAELVAGAVNLSRKNGWIWFVHPIYFAEQLLRVKLSKEVRTAIGTCPDLPPDLPAPDPELVQLQWGRALAGIGRICLDVDGEVDTCLRTEAAAVQVDNPVDVVRLMEKTR